MDGTGPGDIRLGLLMRIVAVVSDVICLQDPDFILRARTAKFNQEQTTSVLSDINIIEHSSNAPLITLFMVKAFKVRFIHVFLVIYSFTSDIHVVAKWKCRAGSS